MHTLRAENLIDGNSTDDRQEHAAAGPGSAFLQWLSLILGITTTTAAPALEEPKDCEPCTTCGRGGNGTKIVGGSETAVNQYPWMCKFNYINRNIFKTIN